MENLKLFGLYEDRHTNKLVAVIRVREDVPKEVITAAWAYAVMYSAKGLTIPDYEAAAKLLQQRHPSWEVVGLELTSIGLDLAKANDDVPEA